MGSDATVRLNCLLFSSANDELARLIRACAEPQSTPVLFHEDDPVQLATILESQKIDLVIVTIGQDVDELPACLSQHPDMTVAVVELPTNATKPLSFWLEQGAHDVISGECKERLSFEITRILRECTLHRELSRTRQQLDAQLHLRQVLIDTHSHAVMLWQQSSVRQSNKLFDLLINCTEQAALTMHWRRWMSAETAHLLEDAQAPGSLQTIITNAAKSQYKASIETVFLAHGPARLLQIDPKPVMHSDTHVSAMEPTVGIPSRRAFTENLQTWLRTLKSHTRFVAMYIRLPDVRSHSGSQGIDETLQDLLTYRAGALLEQNAGHTTVLGRSDQQSLLLVQLQNKSDARSNALSIRALLGTLGGLIDDSRSIRIKTLTSSAGAMGAHEVLWRLESGRTTPTRMRPVDQPDAMAGKHQTSLASPDITLDSAVKPRPEVLRFAHPRAGG